MNREQRRREVAREPGLERECAAARPPDVDLGRRVIERAEEAQSLDVVHVEMGEQDVDRLVSAGIGAEPADARAGVEHQQRAVIASHLDCRGIAAVAGGLRSRSSDRAAGAEQGHTHGHLISQNSAAAPRNSPWRPDRDRGDVDLPAHAVHPPE